LILISLVRWCTAPPAYVKAILHVQQQWSAITWWHIINVPNFLTLWRALLPYRYSYKTSCARSDRVKPSFVIFDIRTLWRSALSVRVPGCQKLQNDGLTGCGTGCFIAVPIYGNSARQRVNNNIKPLNDWIKPKGNNILNLKESSMLNRNGNSDIDRF